MESSKFCFLIMKHSGASHTPDNEVYYYTRSPCPPTTVTLQSTTEAIDTICEDTFTRKSNATTKGGKLYSGKSAIELCTRQCLPFKVLDSSEFCVGFEFDENKVQCFLYNNTYEFNVTSTSSKEYQYMKQDCLTVGYY